jgi:hypothetical protein
MEFELLLRVTSDPLNSTWHRSVERPYSSVPRAGEWIYLDDEETEPRTVTRVTWGNNGIVKLGFGTIDEESDFEARLVEFGFTRAD